MSLKEITKDLHTEAENTKFAKLLLSGNITSEEYLKYLMLMQPIYSLIEISAEEQGLLNTIQGIQRSPGIAADIGELIEGVVQQEFTESLENYVLYLQELTSDESRKHLILAHLYVRHMGDLFGGQFIASKVPGSGKFYEFENPDELKTAIRELLTDDLGDEAMVAFQWTIKIMRELGGE